jgi:hypothetical protein
MNPLTARGLLPIRGRRVGGSSVVCRFTEKRPERVRVCTSESIVQDRQNGSLNVSVRQARFRSDRRSVLCP